MSNIVTIKHGDNAPDKDKLEKYELGYSDNNKALYIKDKNEDVITFTSSGGEYMEKLNPTGTGHFSLNRKSSTTIGTNSFAEGYNTTASGQRSHAEGYNTIASGNSSHAEGSNTKATGDYSHAEGGSTTASNAYSHTEGYNTTASGERSHAEGNGTIASGNYSHAEGSTTIASGNYSHAEGGSVSATHTLSGEGNATTYSYVSGTPKVGRYFKVNGVIIPITAVDTTNKTLTVSQTLSDTEIIEKNYACYYGTLASGKNSHAENTSIAIGEYSHAEGYGTIAKGNYSHAEGDNTTASGTTSHAEGYSTTASGNYSHTEGRGTIASGVYSHAEGYSTTASNNSSHAEGYNTKASGQYSHAEGSSTEATGSYSHAEGYSTTASNNSSHAEGYNTKASGQYSHAEGSSTEATGSYSHAEGYDTEASGGSSHAEGSSTRARGTHSHVEGYGCIVTTDNTVTNQGGTPSADSSYGISGHAEGYQTTVSGKVAHAEGINTLASGYASHAEGSNTKASGDYSHAEGDSTTASGNYSHAEGSNTKASGDYSHAEGSYTTASGERSHAEGNSTFTNFILTGSANATTYDYSHADSYTPMVGRYFKINNTIIPITAVDTTNNKLTVSQTLSNTKITNKEYECYYGTLASGSYSHAENTSIASGERSHSEGFGTVASGSNSHTEGYSTTASGSYSHAEGRLTTASGLQSHAEGYETKASEISSHAEGAYTIASGTGSHAEGAYTIASGERSHAEGSDTEASGDYSHAEGVATIASGERSHAEGSGTTASGDYSHAEGSSTKATGLRSHAEGYGTTASGSNSHAEGYSSVTSFILTGSANATTYTYSHADSYTPMVGRYFKVDGVIIPITAVDTTNNKLTVSQTLSKTTITNKEYECYYGTLASGSYSHAENTSIASGQRSHSEGFGTVASGTGSHAEGYSTTASGNYSHASGYYTKALAYQYVIGHYNKDGTAGSNSGTNGDAFIIGNGSSSSKTNAFYVTYNGQVWAKSEFTTNGADYAEYFEWQDLNPNNDDRRGYFVTLDGEQIKIAKSNDYILGIISGMPAIIGNGDEDWRGRYIYDEFGAFIYEEFEYEEEEFDEETGEIKTITKIGTRYKENPDYDPSLPYIHRGDRPEWDAVGMFGVLSVRDDGTCQVNGYCKVADGGIATSSDTGYRVIKRINNNIIKIVFK